MATAAAPPLPGGIRALSLRRLWDRELDAYPATAPRVFYLALNVVAAVLLYYLYYVPGGVAPNILAYYHMTFTYYIYVSVIAAAFGAFASLIGSLGDRLGRANLTAYGLVVVSLLQLVGVPHAGTKLTYSIIIIAIGFVEGMLLVTTPALVRDFSPQVGRAAAMGFWTLGPVVGSLAVSLVANHTLPHLHPWQDQFVISGIAGLVVGVISVLGLRELSPQLRDQLMVTMRERILVEARAKGIDIRAAIAHPWRQILRLGLISSSFAISVFLLIYYAAVGFFVVYFVVTFHQTTANANGINTWYWAFDAGALIVVGWLSDRLRVRKPFMVVGAIGAIVMTIVFLSRAHVPTTSYYTLVLIVSLLAVSLAIAFAPWMAGYTEAVESVNPALAATGLALWGWIIRAVVALSTLILPHVVTSVTPLIDDASAQTKAMLIQQAGAYIHPVPGSPVPSATPMPPSLARQVAAIGPYGEALVDFADHGGGLAGFVALPKPLQAQLIALQGFQKAGPYLERAETVPASLVAQIRASSPQLASLTLTLERLAQAAKRSPTQFQHWWWVCVAGEGAFLVLVFFMPGFWSPRRAREEVEAHERWVNEELERLQQEGGLAAASS
jgi:hypothetical protein